MVPPSPKSFSKTACGLFSTGSGTVGVRQDNRVEVGAAVTGAAAQADVLDAELDRRQRRVLADVLGGDLVERDADAHGILLRPPAAQENRRRARVLGAGIGAGGAGVHRLLTTVVRSRYFSSGLSVSVNWKSGPSAAGVHLDIVAPCGT